MPQAGLHRRSAAAPVAAQRRAEPVLSLRARRGERSEVLGLKALESLSRETVNGTSSRGPLSAEPRAPGYCVGRGCGVATDELERSVVDTSLSIRSHDQKWSNSSSKKVFRKGVRTLACVSKSSRSRERPDQHARGRSLRQGKCNGLTQRTRSESSLRKTRGTSRSIHDAILHPRIVSARALEGAQVRVIIEGKQPAFGTRRYRDGSMEHHERPAIASSDPGPFAASYVAQHE